MQSNIKNIDETQQGQSTVIEGVETNSKKLFLESYGCQMNFSDSEIVASILKDNGYNTTSVMDEADLILVNTCAIRDKAEQTVRKRLTEYNALKKDKPALRSEEHTSELQSRENLVCRLLLEKKKKK